MRTFTIAALSAAFSLSVLAYPILAAPPANLSSEPVEEQDAFQLRSRASDVGPMPMPLAAATTELLGRAVTPQMRSAFRRGRSVGKSDHDPDDGIERLMAPEVERWLEQEEIEGSSSESSEALAAPLARAAFGAPFTTSRVFPKRQTLSYPYSTIGRIEYRDPATGSVFSCSGSIIAPRLVLTAGHCVYDAEAGRFYADWQFFPSYYDGPSPTGTWTTRQAWVTGQWVAGRGVVPNNGDFGILILHDQNVGGAVSRIGDLLGWLGWQTGLFTEHFTQIGYPFNLDATERPQQTTAQVAIVASTHFLWGTNQRQGSSGSALIMNFGQNGVGQSFPRNRVVGIVSFGVDGDGSAGSSKLRQNFVTLYRDACNAHVGNCP